MNASTLYSRSEEILWRRVGPQVLVADPAGGDVASLSEPTSATWLLLEEPRTIDTIIDALAGEFDVVPSGIAGHVSRILRTLEQRGWITAGTRRG